MDLGFVDFEGIDGRVDMRLTCGIIVVEEKGKLAKENKVRLN